MGQEERIKQKRLKKRGVYKMEKQARTARALLSCLVCPVTKGPLEYDAAAQILISRQIKKAFPIRSGVPILLIEEAQEISIEDMMTDKDLWSNNKK